LITHLREVWPNIHFIVRGDSGFCRQLLIRWCERHYVRYVIGVARNTRLQKAVADWEDELEVPFYKHGLIRDFYDAAETWKYERRIVTAGIWCERP
jgi:hypothetical protein